jgi:hypothetical protein
MVTIKRSKIEHNGAGVEADASSSGTVRATISDSVVSGAGLGTGVGAGSPGWILVDRTKVSGNEFGLTANGSGAEILVRNSSIFGDTTGLLTSNGGTLYSYGNNSVNGNTTNGAFTGTIGLQ